MPRDGRQYDLGLIYLGAVLLFDRVSRDVASDGFAEMLDNRTTPFPFRIVRTADTSW
jgi:hypothetical protein